jgi:hypothetical protein
VPALSFECHELLARRTDELRLDAAVGALRSVKPSCRDISLQVAARVVPISRSCF